MRPASAQHAQRAAPEITLGSGTAHSLLPSAARKYSFCSPAGRRQEMRRLGGCKISKRCEAVRLSRLCRETGRAGTGRGLAEAGGPG